MNIRVIVAVFSLVVGLIEGAAQVVESPTTVARGAWLIESDLGFASWDRIERRAGSIESHEFGVAPLFVSTGLTDNLDVQFGHDGWSSSEETSGGLKTNANGWGDAWIRAKWNFVGDEEIESAWAILPYMKLPTADAEIGNGKFEPGVALVFGRPLTETLWLEAVMSLDSLHNETSGREENLFAGVVLGHDINSSTTVYAELLAEWSRETSDAVPITLGLGISPEIAPGCALDFEALIGVSAESTDLGVAIRLVWEL